MTITSSDATSDAGNVAAEGNAAAQGNAAAEAHVRSPGHAARRLALHFGAVLLGSSALAAVIGGWSVAVSAALGVALAGVNLLLMQRITRAMTVGSDAQGTHPSGAEVGGNAAWGLVLPFKLVALVGVAYALVSRGVAQPVPLAMGFAILPLTGVFLPRPTSLPALAPRPRARPASSHPGPRRGPPASGHGQPAA